MRSLLIRVDPAQLDAALRTWHQAHGSGDTALAIDGKTLRLLQVPSLLLVYRLVNYGNGAKGDRILPWNKPFGDSGARPKLFGHP